MSNEDKVKIKIRINDIPMTHKCTVITQQLCIYYTL